MIRAMILFVASMALGAIARDVLESKRPTTFAVDALRVIVFLVLLGLVAYLVGSFAFDEVRACDPGDQWYEDEHGEPIEGSATVTLQWQPVPDADGYILFVERGKTPNVWNEVARLPCVGGRCPGVDAPIAPVKYYDAISGEDIRYCIKAYNAHGESASCSTAVYVCEPLLLQEIES